MLVFKVWQLCFELCWFTSDFKTNQAEVLIVSLDKKMNQIYFSREVEDCGETLIYWMAVHISSLYYGVVRLLDVKFCTNTLAYISIEQYQSDVCVLS
ncbi:unnamed protein product [Cylicocyclus nassatus]|uniref:Uncharacterized protein n=1 Tax=Cylicocyclus nassatus TaxID=53992 RepID=A0AA36HDR7_CYLNA|nr:unnamed protein product [Cylicocyclus nassatus]